MNELQSLLAEHIEPYLQNLNGHRATALEKYETYLDMLKNRGRDNNLTGFRDYEELVTHVVGDALAPLETAPEGFLEECPEELLDVGTGAGLPGIVYAIYWPECDVFLMESNKKKLEFLQEVIDTLELKNCTILDGRAEIHARELRWRERFDLVTCRALAPLPIALELCLPYLVLDGWMLTFKGPSGPKVSEEIDDARFALDKLGAGEPEVRTYTPGPGAKPSSALWIPKTGLTPDRYPRREGIPAKRPLRASRG
ncbi:MAG: 16S rRNA (guanine(527)-N(7))-methyltransferase RsmG [Sumerlaeia bacterium]